MFLAFQPETGDFKPIKAAEQSSRRPRSATKSFDRTVPEEESENMTGPSPTISFSYEGPHVSRFCYVSYPEPARPSWMESPESTYSFLTSPPLHYGTGTSASLGSSPLPTASKWSTSSSGDSPPADHAPVSQSGLTVRWPPQGWDATPLLPGSCMLQDKDTCDLMNNTHMLSSSFHRSSLSASYGIPAGTIYTAPPHAEEHPPEEEDGCDGYFGLEEEPVLRTTSSPANDWRLDARFSPARSQDACAVTPLMNRDPSTATSASSPPTTIPKEELVLHILDSMKASGFRSVGRLLAGFLNPDADYSSNKTLDFAMWEFMHNLWLLSTLLLCWK
ncbi:hypothetical protein OE88DRAFT_1809152 [Heliocybe sulcata]|uniref:Uncharacterized protein n=1 Tax=Heliocybe sulcata TaxID=5364 RepID=A0A5C3MXV1_9AGAM|nr:hypothetical protein OE88DRAFT_1809152 [Heliocybe sulcata]